MTKTITRPIYNASDPKQLASVYEQVKKARALAQDAPEVVRRHEIVATLRATASSQNIEGGHSTPLGVARAVITGGDSLRP